MKLAAAALGLLLSLQAALAAEPIYPPASRVGLVPLEDMVPSKRFTGFENPQKAAAITITELPAQAYEQIVSGMTKDSLRRQGLDVTAREQLKIQGKSGLLISGAMTGPIKGRKWVLALKGSDLTALLVAQVEGGDDGYSEQEMRTALKSVALRGPVTLEEQMSALPFRVRDQAGFRPVRVTSGNSVLFTEGPKDTIKAVEQPILILAASQAPIALNGDRRDQFAQAALNSNQMLKDVTIERSESFRLQGQDWHEIVARAKDGATGEPIVVMQTIRFDSGRYVRMVGLTRVADRQTYLPRFRQMIDKVELDF
ncbi:discoidin domain-containing protein [Microvirga rosea]|uniref:discoidin domain-containing protein n=1 Tax=Microvirga rosea TaxID=2715425 RepID=UPI001D0A4D48|nr:discoidin domain-containing protein [Microvirga rosea]MCB8821868.1 discoidin domain-containing protein [Microvirga rosea]